jgi:hypothetical protein
MEPAPIFTAFISHASADSERAQEICASLEARGLKCWIAPRDVRPGHDYGEEILYGIERSRCLVLVLSEAANQSIYVPREVERAVSYGRPIFPVRIEEIVPSRSLEFFVAGSQWVDAWGERLVTELGRLAETLAAPQAAGSSGTGGTGGPEASGGTASPTGGSREEEYGTFRRGPAGQSRDVSTPMSFPEMGSKNSRKRVAVGIVAGLMVVLGLVAGSFVQDGLVGGGGAHDEQSLNPLATDTPEAEPAKKETEPAPDPTDHGEQTGGRSSGSSGGEIQSGPSGRALVQSPPLPAAEDPSPTPESLAGMLVAVVGEGPGHETTEFAILDQVELDEGQARGLSMGEWSAVESAEAQGNELERLRKMALDRGFKFLLVGELATRSAVSYGSIFSGSGELSLRLYSTWDGQLLESDRVAVGSGGQPARRGASVAGAREEAARAVGSAGGRLVNGWLR